MFMSIKVTLYLTITAFLTQKNYFGVEAEQLRSQNSASHRDPAQ